MKKYFKKIISHTLSTYPCERLLISPGVTIIVRVGILARLRIIDPLFFLWTHKFQLKLTITRPHGRACIHSGVKISNGKSLTISHFCPPNYQNIELHVLNLRSLQIMANHQ